MKDFLGEFGPDRKEGSRASNGGQMEKKELPYDPPKGPKGQMQQGPGNHGTNHGNAGTQGRR